MTGHRAQRPDLLRSDEMAPSSSLSSPVASSPPMRPLATPTAPAVAQPSSTTPAAGNSMTVGYPPLLVCGTAERVGSNWLSDTLRSRMAQHNEPLRQQLAASHPLSALNPTLAPPSRLPLRADGGLELEIADNYGRWWTQVRRELDPFAAYWLAVFTAAKFSPTPQMVKETNLFHAWPVFLGLFPGAAVVVLSRSPVGVASSFARGHLYERWDYPTRYRTLAAASAASPSGPPWGLLLPDDEPPSHVGLTRLTVLNALLLAHALDDRPHGHVPYESALYDPGLGVRVVAEQLRPHLPVEMLAPLLFTTSSSDHTTRRADDTRALPQSAHPSGTPGQAEAVVPDVDRLDDTYATVSRTSDLLAHLDASTADHVRAETAATLDTGATLCPPAVVARACSWLSGDHLYQLAPLDSPSTRTAQPHRAQVTSSVGRDASDSYTDSGGGASAWTPAPGLSQLTWPLTWRAALISNNEFARFLDDLATAGLRNVHASTHLLALTCMPHQRGGRLHPAGYGHRISPGYGDHPVYWVTWIGAAAYAALVGARLPTRAEAHVLTRGRLGHLRQVRDKLGDHRPTTATQGRSRGELPQELARLNVGYRYGDVLPVLETAADAETHGRIHHALGNLAVWCLDGPAPTPSGSTPTIGRPTQRWLHGAAWNTPVGTADDGNDLLDRLDTELSTLIARHLTGASRSVGIRLVRDLDHPRNPVPIDELAHLLNTWLADLPPAACLPDHPGSALPPPYAPLENALIEALAPPPPHGCVPKTPARPVQASGHGE
ncbi:MAG: hypothetical protein QG622_1826 [Actinomycetota bacterium]|nr:hypothetical protein [Actinomycetota bacterium]